MKMKLLGGAALAAIGALWLTPAMAQPTAWGVNPGAISGTVDVGGSYQSLGDKNAGTTENASQWNVDGAVFVPLGTNWAVQANGGYNAFGLREGGDSETFNTWNIAGSAMYIDPRGVRIGGTVSYGSQDVSEFGGHGLTLTGTTYGLFGDWYANHWLTLSARGGGLSASASGFGMSLHIGNGGYAGAQIVGYPTTNIAISGVVDYLQFPIESESFTTTTVGFGGEFRVFPKCPMTIGAFYAYNTIKVEGESVNGSAFGLRLKYYWGPGGTLEDQQRGGTESWATASPVQHGVLNFGE